MTRPSRSTTGSFYVGAVFAVCFALWSGWGLLFLAADVRGWGRGLEAFGQFGDTFGAINALFTALAFAAVWWTGWMQRGELQLQREQLDLQRQELAETRIVFEAQKFEDRFFNHLSLIRDITGGLDYANERGSAALNYISSQLQRSISIETNSGSNIDEWIEFCKTNLWTAYDGAVGPLIRTLYYLIEFVDKQIALSESDRREYANIARAQIGSDFLVVLAIDAVLSSRGDFPRLMGKYAILRHLPDFEGLRSLRDRLPPEAFMSARDQAS